MEIKKPTIEELKRADESVRIIVLTRGELEDGRPFYAYVLMPPSKYPQFMEAEKKGNYVLEDFGEVVSFGNEKNPPPEVVIEMYKKYGATPSFMEDLKKGAEQLMKEKEEAEKSGGLLPGKIKDLLKRKKTSDDDDGDTKPTDI